MHTIFQTRPTSRAFHHILRPCQSHVHLFFHLIIKACVNPSLTFCLSLSLAYSLFLFDLSSTSRAHAYDSKIEISDNDSNDNDNDDAADARNGGGRTARTGALAARKYMRKRASVDNESNDNTDNASSSSTSSSGHSSNRSGGSKSSPSSASASSSWSTSSSDPHYLAIHLGGFVSDDAYKWGHAEHESDVGRWNAGLTYRFGEWVNSMDFTLRFDVSTFHLNEGTASQIGILPVLLLPDAQSHFPIYFGGGVGIGIMSKQLRAESPLTLLYHLFIGVRFFNLFEKTGLFVEAGIKNHLHLASDGQFNGFYMVAGPVFTF